MSSFSLFYNRWQHYLTSQTEYNLHSPFVFDFYTKVVKNKFPYKEFKELKQKDKEGSNRKLQQLLFRTARYYKPKTIIQLGNLQSDSLYLALGNRTAKVFVIDTEENLRKEAKLPNIQFFGINSLWNKEVFIQGSQAGMVVVESSYLQSEWLEIAFQYSQNESIFVLKGIHESEQNKQQWNKLKSNPEISVSVDLFFAGFLFFKKELSHQDFTLRY